MSKFYISVIASAIGLVSFTTEAMLYKCDSFNENSKTCRLIGWHGTQPSSGKLRLPSTYTDENNITYTITTVDDYALNNLTEITEITIPATYKEIGRAYATYVVNARTHNFENCPSLKLFKVEEGSPLFEASDDGILYLKGRKTMMHVPAKYVTTGNFTIPEGCRHIAPDAFAGNTTIFYIEIPKSTEIYENGGLNRMENLSAYKLLNSSDKAVLSEKDGVIISNKRIVACPPYSAVVSFNIPESITEISDYAFYNCSSLGNITVPTTVTRIGAQAFSKSGIIKLALPGNLEKLGDGAVKSCQKLSSVKFQNSDVRISNRFASDCGALTKVESTYPIAMVGESAFKNCRELKTFPFRGEIVLSEDSAFYNTGFESIVFEESEMTDAFCGSHIFSYCRNLEVLDFSKVIMDNPGQGLSIGDSFATNCLKLKKVNLGDYTGFWAYKLPERTTPPAFGYSCVIDTLFIGSTSGSDDPHFCYSTINGKQHFTPVVYARTTKNADYSPQSYNRLNICNLFAAGNGATVAPIIYLDAYKLSEPRWPDYRDYVVPGATYFIPGGTSSNYSLAQEKGNRVEEMYNISFDNSGLYLKMAVSTRDAGVNTPEISDFMAIFPSGKTVKADDSGIIVSPESINANQRIRLSYKVNGNYFLTDYPSTHWITSGLVQQNIDYKILKNGTEISFGEKIKYEIFSTAGVKLLSGENDSVDVSHLPEGIVIIKISGDNNNIKTIKINL